jgi:D-tyrosyl-tRNA(Tyr) deacylase
MRACIQRVLSASVTLPQENGWIAGKIGQGLLILLGVGTEDTETESVLLAKKCAELRIFEDDNGKMNRSVGDVGGSVLIVSQFTLYADCTHGRRPSFTTAAPPESANMLYRRFAEEIRHLQISVATGVFRTKMHIHLINDGPVTVWLDTADFTRNRK